MLRTEIKPDNFTYSFMTRAYSEGLDLDGLKVAHGVIVSGLGLDSICSSALVTAYSKLALIDEANKVFHGMPEPDGTLEFCDFCLWELWTLSPALESWPKIAWFCGLIQPDLVTWSALITGYSQSGDTEKAFFLFKELNWDGKKANSVLIATVLAAAAQVANVGSGKEFMRIVFDMDMNYMSRFALL
ncbi:hypothetical protein FNV43_RR20252 [Rhamnella rubrinervis]|uniref:Pentatricopeptide repeat-containing protein n=1 Tax=Rhamnella rubrinervis TaxID=2594499 RepID=A0A8K0GT76_9ROSA|nr:hypothetical protein FNV43_RR20252 [Rhamnella rubrinervis]